MDQLEKVCDECKGYKYVQDHIPGYNKTCPKCDGNGVVPTYHGEMVLSLILHNLKSLLKELAK